MYRLPWDYDLWKTTEPPREEEDSDEWFEPFAVYESEDEEEEEE